MALANVVVTVNEPNVTVSSDNVNVTVAQTTTNVTVGNATITANADVRAAISVTDTGGFGNLTYAEANGVFTFAGTSSSDIRTSVSVTDAGGDGSLAYDNGTGVVTYTGPSAAEVRAHFSNTSPITYNASTGVIGIDSGALFTGKTTDDLTEGSTNLYYTDARSRAALSVATAAESGNGSLTYNSSVGEFTFTPANINAVIGSFINTSTNNGYPNKAVWYPATGNMWVDDIKDNLTVYNGNKFNTGDTWFQTNNSSGTTPGDEIMPTIVRAGGNAQPSGSALTNTVTVRYNTKSVLCYNNSGSTVLAGQSVYSTGNFANSMPQINGLSSSHQESSLAFGIAVEDVLDGEQGKILQRGYVKIVNPSRTFKTATFPAVNEKIYTAEGNADGLSGQLSNAPGSYPQYVGIVSAYKEQIDSSVDYYLLFVDYTAQPISYSNEQSIKKLSGTTDVSTATFTGPMQVNGNLEVTGNLNYQNVTDLYVRDQSITLNANATTNASIELIANEPQWTYNPKVIFNIVTGRWEFTDGNTGDSTYHVNSNADVVAYISNNALTVGGNLVSSAITTLSSLNVSGVTTLTNDLNSNANISTTANVSGAYILGNGSQLTGIDYLTNAQVKTYIEGTGLNATANLNTTANASATYFIGNGSLLTGIDTPDLNLGNIFVGGSANVTTQVTPSTNFVTQVTTTASTTFSIESITPYLNGSVNVDAVTFVGGQIYSDGLEVVISGVTAGGATALNGLTFYLKWTSNDGGVYELYDNVGLTTASQRATGSYINPTNGIITYTTGSVITPKFELSNTISNVNSITAETGSNITLSTTGQVVAGNITVDNISADNITAGNISAPGTDDLVLEGNVVVLDSKGQNITLEKDFTNGANTSYAEIDGEGYAVSSMNNPTYSGTDNIEAWIIEGSATAGSAVIAVTGAIDFKANYTSNTQPDAGNRTALFAAIRAGYVPWASKGNNPTQSPFPPGTYIVSFDSGANTITMSNDAVVSVTFENSTNKLLGLFAGGYNTAIGYAEAYYSSYDLGGSDKTTIAYAQPIVYARYGWGTNGPSRTDLTYGAGIAAEYTQPTYTTAYSKVMIRPERGYLGTQYGITVGNNAQLMNRLENDQFNNIGISILWDGTEDTGTTIGPNANNPIPQIGMKTYTDNSSTTNGQRLNFISARGNINDDPFTTYPRAGQPMGRVQWWGTHGTNISPSSTAAPAYLEVQAHDDWSTGSNADIYLVGTSEYGAGSGITQRDTVFTYEGGKTIISSGNASSVPQDLTFAPKKFVASNPSGAYDFSAPGGDQKWVDVNYANVTAASGSLVSINNGGSGGAGTVGDMSLKLHRVDNTYNQSLTHTVSEVYPNYGGVADLIAMSPTGWAGTNFEGALEGTGPLSDFVNANATGLNGVTVFLKLAFGGAYSNRYYFLYSDAGLTTPVRLATGSVPGTGVGVYTYSSASASGVTDKQWSLTLAEQSEDLVLKGNTTTQVTFTDTTTIFSSRVRFQSFTTTEINALASPQAGDTVFNTTLADICFYDGTAWQKVNKATM
jgi:hypothetical protein